MRTVGSAARPYHHGDLRNALVDAGVGLAREGGPDAIVLREAARRVGVSPNAAYRHFVALPDLLEAVAAKGFNALALAMRKELADCPVSGTAASDAAARLRAVGRAYIQFALREPGLFAATFDATHDAALIPPEELVAGNPYDILNDVLDEMLAAGALAAADRPGATMMAWAAVHGMSMLLLGPLAGVPAQERDQMVAACLDLTLRGLLVR